MPAGHVCPVIVCFFGLITHGLSGEFAFQVGGDDVK